jgi:hypothetical protein
MPAAISGFAQSGKPLKALLVKTLTTPLFLLITALMYGQNYFILPLQ